ncbi:MAG: PH domain-containing protein [Haloarculaceae archaeon]
MTRLHVLSVPLRAAESLLRLAWVLVLATIGSASAGLQVPLVVAIVGGGLVLALAYQALYYRRFEYGLTGDTFDVRSGVLSRRVREIPFRRVQNVDVSRNAVQRALGVAELRVETAGGGETEAVLRYVAIDEARRLQNELGRRGRDEGGETDERGEPEPAALFSLSPHELVVLGFTALDLRFVSVLFVGITVVAPGLAARLEPAPGTAIVAAPLLLAGVYLVAAAVSGVVSMTNYYGFRLSRVGDELRYERGLVQHFAGTIPQAKVQTLTVRSNVLARALGYASLAVETAGYAPGDADRSTVVPIARRPRVLALTRSIEAFEDVAFDDATFERPPPRARTRYAARYAVALAVLVALAVAVDRATPFRLAWYLPLVLLPVVPVAAHVKWRHRGYALLDDHVLTRNGFWIETITVVPYYRVQTVVSSATAFQRRRDLATLTVDTAGSRRLTGGQPSAADLDADRAADLRETVAARLQDALAVRRTARRLRVPDSDDREDRGPAGAPG